MTQQQLSTCNTQPPTMSSHLIQSSSFTSKDINEIVAIHRQEINQGFISSLGNRTLELVFEVAASGKWGILLASREGPGGPVTGFLLGALDTGALYRDFILRKSILAAIDLVPKLLNFDSIYKILETLFYPARKFMQGLPGPELLDIAVARSYQGTGLARDLFIEFKNLLLQRGITEFKVSTGESLIRAQRFYEKLGARKAAVIEVHKRQKSIIYIYNCESKLSQ